MGAVQLQLFKYWHLRMFLPQNLYLSIFTFNCFLQTYAQRCPMHVFFLNLPGILHLLLFFRLGAIGSQERGVPVWEPTFHFPKTARWSKSLLWEPAPPTKKGKGKDCQDFLGWEKNEWDLTNQHRLFGSCYITRDYLAYKRVFSEVFLVLWLLLGPISWRKSPTGNP